MRDVERVAKVIGTCANDVAFVSCLKENGVDDAIIVGDEDVRIVMIKVGVKDRVYVAMRRNGKTFVYRYDLARVYVF